MASPFELLTILLSSFGLNLIPFVGPSDLFIASNFALVVGATDPLTLAVIGFLVALGAALAISIQYMITFFAGRYLSDKQRQRLDAEALKIKRWAFFLLLGVAATPVPDEPVIVPLGLMKYSPLKFFLAFFLGKLSITVLGAFLGGWTNSVFSGWLSSEIMIALSVALTIVITIILLKVDLGKLAEKILKRKTGSQKPKTI